MKLLQEELAAEGQTAQRINPVEVRPLGEARNIYDRKGQFVSILGSNPLFHHPDDRWSHAIDLPRTEALLRGMLQVAKQLAGS